MKNFPYLGPSIVVLAAGAVALVVAPMVVRSANDARATVEIAQASNLLSQGVDIAPVGFSQHAGDALAQDGARDAVFSVPEDRVALMRAGSEVQVRGWSDERTATGRVREVAASADPVTRTFLVKVGLPADAPWALGATVSVAPRALARGGAPVIKLPTSALRQMADGTSVWVVDRATMTVKAQPVQVTTADGNDAVIGSGLQPGMLVVAAGVHVLSPGEKVTLWQEKK